jgi:hypothetical protein
MLGDSVELADPADLERGDKIEPEPKEQRTPAKVVKLSDFTVNQPDTPEGRVAAARARRAQMLGTNSR